MPSRWDGKVGKIPKVGDKRETKRFSPKVRQQQESFENDCCDCDPNSLSEGDGVGNPRQPGEAQLYTPETVSQYKSQWSRFQRALELLPAQIKQEGKKTVYRYRSCDSTSGFWDVSVSTGATYLRVTKPTLQIMCPVPTMLDIVDSDADTFTWSQKRGSRSAIINDYILSREQSPPVEANPTLNLLSICTSNGCYDGSVDPVVIYVQPEDQPELFDSITIYTTPTSSHYGNSFEVAIAAPDVDPNRRVTTLRPAAPPPQYLQRAYAVNAPGTYLFTWDLPASDQSFLTGTVWQQNTTGEYLDVERFSRLDNRLFTASLNTHYRVRSVYNVYGNTSAVDSDRFYFTNPNRVVVADDSLNGLSATGLKSTITKLPLGRIGRSVEDKLDGISAVGLKTSITKLPLSRKLLQPSGDTLDGISWTGLKSTIEKRNLGGMIIR